MSVDLYQHSLGGDSKLKHWDASPIDFGALRASLKPRAFKTTT